MDFSNLSESILNSKALLRVLAKKNSSLCLRAISTYKNEAKHISWVSAILCNLPMMLLPLLLLV